MCETDSIAFDEKLPTRSCGFTFVMEGRMKYLPGWGSLLGSHEIIPINSDRYDELPPRRNAGVPARRSAL
ncbi:MAG: hypothetical protein WCI73_02315 [Phycisphaerae bacterium]